MLPLKILEGRHTSLQISTVLPVAIESSTSSFYNIIINCSLLGKNQIKQVYYASNSCLGEKKTFIKILEPHPLRQDAPYHQLLETETEKKDSPVPSHANSQA